MITIGIDPGQSGGLAILDGPELVLSIRMPVMTFRGKKLLDVTEVQAFFPKYRDKVQIVIEQVNAMPKQGVSSSFQFGKMTGAIDAAVRCCYPGSPVEYVTPAVWKKAMGLTSSKQDSLDLAKLRFGSDPIWQVKANDGIAEAALLAAYWRDKNQIQ